MLDLITPAAVGVVQGIVGTAVGAMSRRSERAHELAMSEQANAQQRWALQNAARLQLSGEQTQLHMASYVHDTSLNVDPNSWVQKWRAAVRPAVVTALVLALFVVVGVVLSNYYAYDVKIAPNSTEDRLIWALVNMTSTVITWWHGGRDSTTKK